MTFSAVLENMVSLVVQVSLLVLCTAWLSRQARREKTGDQIWFACHALILTLTAAAFLLPQFRLFPLSRLVDAHRRIELRQTADVVGLVVAGIWLTGFVPALLSLVISTVRIQRILGQTSEQSVSVLRRRCGGIPEQLPDGRKIRWCILNAGVSPFCWQIHQPYVVLPSFVLDFDDDELEAVCRHEAAHLIAGHPLGLFVQRFVEIVYWFHPLVWWGSWRAAAYREFLCDQAAGRDSESASACLRALVKLSEHGICLTGGVPAGLSFGAGQSLMQQRAARLAEVSECSHTKSDSLLLPAAVVVSAVFVWCLHVPLNAAASDRSLWSPWPEWSASTLGAFGVNVRDYEIDNHRLEIHHASGSRSEILPEQKRNF